MLDTDTLLMTRAIELARQGAGLVSPNPMVGAVLVNEGRVIGEGYHRYDRLKHAESYAIETAKSLARGATLYCNLEPCCHHGRTPPCTEALIAAGISRAVISVKDPDRRVNGRGIEQLTDAGIDVEIGVLEEAALRLNETYFKFITTGVPFLHGVIEWPGDDPGSALEWSPSDQFLRDAFEYDAVLIGDKTRLNKTVLESAVSRERHRALAVVANEAAPPLLNDLGGRSARISVVPFAIEPPGADAFRKVVRLDEAAAQGAARSQVRSVAAALARMQVTSLLMLPGLLDLADVSNFAELDKLTMVLPSDSSGRIPTQWVLGNLEFDLEGGKASDAAGRVELTGYPSLRGVA